MNFETGRFGLTAFSLVKPFILLLLALATFLIGAVESNASVPSSAPSPMLSSGVSRAAVLNASCPIVRESNDAELAKLSDDYVLARGSVLLEVKETFQLKSAGTVIEFEKGVVALVTRENGYLRVANLCENKCGSIKINIADKTICLFGGNDFVLAKNAEALHVWLEADQTARRRMELIALPNGPLYTVSEFFPPTLIEHTGMVKALRKSEDHEEKALFGRVLKFAVCLLIATESHGNYDFVR